MILVGLLLVNSSENGTLGEGEVLSVPKIHHVRMYFCLLNESLCFPYLNREVALSIQCYSLIESKSFMVIGESSSRGFIA